MATNQKQASIARTITFRSNGSHNSTFLHASTGNLIQEYDGDGNYYPEITPTEPIRLKFTATSSRTQGVVVPDSITYKIGSVTLAFNSSGVCTTTGKNEASYFKKDGADLLIIGNIAEYLDNTSSMIEALAKKGTEDLYASCPVEIYERLGGRRQKVSIAPGDDKNFTLTSQSDSVKLKAGVLTKTGWTYNSNGYTYIWETTDATTATGWRCIKLGSGSNGTLTLKASEVDTYANIRCTVAINLQNNAYTGNASTFNWASVLKGNIVGADCVGVLDASDPLDIICAVFINKTGTGTPVAADEEALDDSLPLGAYLKYVPTIVVRGTDTPAGSTTWLTGKLVDPAGVDIKNPEPENGAYIVKVEDLMPYFGQHTLVMTGKLT